MGKELFSLVASCLLMAFFPCQLNAALIVGYSPDVPVIPGMNASIIDDTGSNAVITVGTGGSFGDYINLSPSAAGASGSDAVTNGDFFQLALTAEPGKTFDLARLDFEAYKGGISSPRGWALTSSADSYASIIDEDIITADIDSPAPDSFSVDLSSYTGLSDITLRMYGFSPATFNVVNFRELLVSGTVYNVSTIPAPGALALVATGLLSLSRLRRRRAQ